ncbi:MAG TPA: hypothetical protein IAD47_04360 [Candidatus Limihabitans stercoravium]|nr:hypothetical protein [Candidatus Limihabitans stercoravium]
MNKQGSDPTSDNGKNQEINSTDLTSKSKAQDKTNPKKKKKKNLWPLKACLITLVLSFAVNTASELALTGAHIAIAIVITLVIVMIGVFFDIIGTASTSCDIQPFLAMASRKVKGAKTAVKFAKNSDVVSSVCNDIIGDICGVVSGVCGAAIVGNVTGNVTGNFSFWFSVLTYAIVSTLTITGKALGKNYAVNNANKIVFNTAKFISLFSKEG